MAANEGDIDLNLFESRNRYYRKLGVMYFFFGSIEKQATSNQERSDTDSSISAESLENLSGQETFDLDEKITYVSAYTNIVKKIESDKSQIHLDYDDDFSKFIEKNIKKSRIEVLNFLQKLDNEAELKEELVQPTVNYGLIADPHQKKLWDAVQKLANKMGAAEGARETTRTKEAENTEEKLPVVNESLQGLARYKLEDWLIPTPKRSRRKPQELDTASESSPVITFIFGKR